MIFHCESAGVEAVLRDLGALVHELGGRIDDQVIVNEHQGRFSIGSTRRDGARVDLIHLPGFCLPSTDHFDWTFHGGEIRATPKPGTENSERDLMQLMIAAYQAARKVPRHKAANPWFTLADEPGLLNSLLQLRNGNQPLLARLNHVLEANDDDLFFHTFFLSRQFSQRNPGADDASARLMPFVDFANHHPRSPCIVTSRNERDLSAISLVKSQPVEGSDECFVRYGTLDALDLFLGHGYVDHHVEFVRSVPMEIPTEEFGTIRIFSHTTSISRRGIPPELADLRLYLPRRLSGEGIDDIHLSHLIIPGPDLDRALRRVLSYFLHKGKPDLHYQAVKAAVIDIESQVVRENLRRYSEISTMVKEVDTTIVSPEALTPLKALVEAQIQKLEHYRERASRLLR